MLFFNYENMYILSSGKSSKIIALLRGLAKSPDKFKAISGYSFILNEKTILDNPFGLTDRQLAEYLGLLSIRSYQNYVVTGDPSLDIELMYPWLPKEVTTTNPLIAINKSKIQFIEELIND